MVNFGGLCGMVSLFLPLSLFPNGVKNAPDRLIGNVIVFGNLTQRFILFGAVQDIRPLFLGDTVSRFRWAGAALLAGFGGRSIKIRLRCDLAGCHTYQPKNWCDRNRRDSNPRSSA